MTVATDNSSLLWVAADKMPANVADAVRGRWQIVPAPWAGSIAPHLRTASVAVICPPIDDRFDVRWLTELLDQLDRSGAVAVVLLPPGLPADNVLAKRRGQYVLMSADTPPAELSGAIAAAAAIQPAIRHLQNDVSAARSFSDGDDRGAFDEEMRLAARLQRDFLPQDLPRVGPVGFAGLFRPATWVSGDIYDVFRLDEHHVGFYVADVVGHGLPAALLTIFIKKSLQTKRILGHSYEIVPPSITLALLNDDICQQGLTSCQFCTAWYGIIDVRSLRLRYARGGHPPALLLGGGSARPLDAPGPLLGVFPQETFQSQELTLERGQRIVVFSDGAEEALGGNDGQGPSRLGQICQELGHLEAEQMALHLTARIDECRASDRHADDVTVLIMDVEA